MVSDKVLLTMAGVLSESVTCRPTLKVPGWVGVPEMTPVLVFRLSPGGRSPETMLQLKGPVPPETVRVVV
jgi:hypothetical protein